MKKPDKKKKRNKKQIEKNKSQIKGNQWKGQFEKIKTGRLRYPTMVSMTICKLEQNKKGLFFLFLTQNGND